MKSRLLAIIAFVALLFGAVAYGQEPLVTKDIGTNNSPNRITAAGVTNTSLNAADATRVQNQWSYSISTVLMSTYYGTIFGGNFYPGPMSFTDFVASRNNSLGALSFDLAIGQKLDRLDKYNRDGGNEYDITVDQSFRVGSKAYPILGDVGVTYLALYDLEQTRDDAFSEYVRLDFPIRADLKRPIIQPYIQGYHYHMVGNGTQDKGWIGYVGLIRDQQLGSLKLFGNDLVLNLDYRMGVNAGVYDSHKGIEYHRLALTLPIQYGKWLFAPSVIGQLQGGPDQTYVHKNEVFYSLFIKRTF